MLRVTLALSSDGQELHLSCAEAKCDARHRLVEADWKAFRTANAMYHRILNAPGSDSEARLRRIGNEMRLWIEASFPHCLAAILAAGSAPLLWEVVAHSVAEKPRLLLDAPWELVGDENEHWAKNARIKFCPVRRLGAAGKPKAPSAYSLNVVFMSASPVGTNLLQFEAEERVIQELTRNLKLELMVEDFGTLQSLGDLVTATRPDVVHVSCHGKLENPPILLLEDEIGAAAPTTPEQLNDALEDKGTRLLFLSACQTAKSDALVPSLVWGVLGQAAPAVLGWAGNVLDHEATHFAHLIYKRLSDQRPLEQAVAMARYDLLTAPPNALSATPRAASGAGAGAARDWHLARLYLAPDGGGVLATGLAGVRQRHLLASKGSLARNNLSPVAGPEQFVGRRRELQTVLREFKNHTSGGVLIHGIGQSGKSSLAERVKARYQQRGYAVPVVFDPDKNAANYRAAALWETVTAELRDADARAHCEKHKEEIARNPAHLQEALRQLLEGECSQFVRHEQTLAVQKQPILLIIDDFEKVLQEQNSGHHLLKDAEFAATMKAVIAAFTRTATQSRLLLTSRFLFTLKDGNHEWAAELFNLSLPPMEDADRYKMAATQQRRLVSAEKQAAKTPAQQDEENARTLRLIAAARGHAGLQDYLFYLSLDDAARCDALLGEIEEYWTTGAAHTQKQSEIFAYLENLTLTVLLNLLSETQRHLLEASTLFNLPVPETVIEAFGIGTQADRARLQALGLWYSQKDDFDKSRRALAINPLVRLMLKPLAEHIAEALAPRVVQPLFAAWGGAAGTRKRTTAHKMELTQVALLAQDAEVLTHSAWYTVQALHIADDFKSGAAIGEKAIAIINAAKREAPLLLHKFTAESQQYLGKVQEAAANLAIGLERSRAQRQSGQDFNEGEYAALLLVHARLIAEQGQVDEALKEFEEYQALAKTKYKQGIALVEIARLKADKGQVDEALELNEKVLQVYVELGDKRSHAVTLGDIARLKAGKGQVDEALELNEKVLQVYVELGDRRSHATTLGDIARLKAGKGRLDEALELHKKELQVYVELGDKRSHAVTLGNIARLKAGKGQLDEALELIQQRLQVAEEMGDLSGIANACWSMAKIELDQEKYQEAYEHFVASYEINLKLGRLDGICAVGADLGTLLCRTQQAEEGLKLLARSHAGYLQLGRAREAAIVERAMQFYGGGAA